MSKKNGQLSPWRLIPNPPGVIRYIPIRQIGSHDDLKVIVLSSEVYGLMTHWTGRQTVPCTFRADDEQSCKHHNAPSRWKAYLHVWSQTLKTSFFVELTALGVGKLQAELGANALRGSIVLLRRDRPTKKAPIGVSYLGRAPEGFQLPKEESPEETLKRLWGIE